MKPKAFIGVLHQDMEQQSLLKHPFYQLWNEGKLSKEALVAYAKQYYHFTEHFPRFVAGVYRNCKDPVVRQVILHNLIEEELGDMNDVHPHADQWLGFCEALGIPQTEVRTSEQLASTKEFLETFEHLTRDDFLGGVGAVLAYELQVPAIAKTKKEGLVKHFGMNQGLKFFDTHMEADIKHAQVWKDILAEAAPEEQQRIRASFQRALAAQWKLLDGIMEHTRCSC